MAKNPWWWNMPSAPATIRSQAGLGLPLAIAILLLLAAVAGGVTAWMGSAREGVAAEATSLRAEAAARSGLEWARHQIIGTGCPSGDVTLELGQGSDCIAVLEDGKCQAVSGGRSPVYVVEMVGQCPLWGDLKITRTLRMRMRDNE